MSELTQESLEAFAESIATLIATKNTEFVQKLIGLQAAELQAALDAHTKQLRLMRQSRVDMRATSFMSTILQVALQKVEAGERPLAEQMAHFLEEGPHTAYTLAERMERRALVSEMQAEARLQEAQESA